VAQIPADTVDQQINAIARQYRFDIGKWEVETLGKELGDLFTEKTPISTENTSVVLTYFDNLARIRGLEAAINAINEGTREGNLEAYESERDLLRRQNEDMIETVQRVLEEQVKEVLVEQEIYSPWGEKPGNEFIFPPVNFILSKPPRLLVVSPRDRIERIANITLLPDIEVPEMENIESQVTGLDYSGLVTGLGGIATYPSYVTDNADLAFVIDTIVEEWLHQYLAFKPLGFLYVLDLTGIRHDYEIAKMNETLAGIFSEEIGAIIYNRYYFSGEPEPPAETEPEFDFNKEMRETRRKVDEMLAQGRVEEAEAYMEERRRFINENGYYIRKLNQAYFAFHGTYADSPTSIDPIGVEMKQLREETGSLKDFLEIVAEMTTRQDLAGSVD
jgi:hypothetical protein